MAMNCETVLLDTNIIIDAFDVSRPGYPHATHLLLQSIDEPGTLRIIANITSFKDAYYVLGRLYHDEGKARYYLQQFMEKVIEPVDMRAIYGQRALSDDEPDFEDGLIRACAEAEGANCIITRDAKAFKGSRIPSMTAEEYLKLHNDYYEEIEF